MAVDMRRQAVKQKSRHKNCGQVSRRVRGLWLLWHKGPNQHTKSSPWALVVQIQNGEVQWSGIGANNELCSANQ
jgi:hypothetical protein